MNRREFIGSSAAAAAATTVFGWPAGIDAQTAATPIGIQIGAVSFLDQGTLTPEQTTEFTYRVQQYGAEAPVDQLPAAGFSADYVRRETRRAVAGVTGHTRIWPGIEIDVPTGDHEKKTTPDSAYQAVRATFDVGAHGLILSRKYSEMKLDNLRAAGRAIRESVRTPGR